MTYDKPELQITTAAESADWLRENLGAGPLGCLFRRGGQIVHTPLMGEDGYIPPAKDEDDDGPAQIRSIDRVGVTARVQFMFRCFRVTKKKGGAEETPTLFPEAAAKLVCAAPDMAPNLRPLRGVIHVPVPRVDGSLITTPGYDEQSQLLYLPAPGLDIPGIPEKPTVEEIDAATGLLYEMLEGFEFQSDDDFANYVGFLLTPLLRLLCPGPYKLTAIGAPMPGSGKSLLAQIARQIHGGVFRSEVPDNAEEMRKAITTILDGTSGPVVQLDNVSGVLNSSVLAGLLTTPEWTDRKLGSNATISAVNDRAWCVTGNNLRLGGDLVRRTVQITIDPGCPNPHLRNDFKILDLTAWVAGRRGDLVAALLTLVQAWAVAGRPVRKKAGADSYKRWIETVDGILGVAGFVGEFDGEKAQRTTVGEEDQEWRDFLDAVHGQFGTGTWTVRELLGKVRDTPSNVTELNEFERAKQASQPIPLDALPAFLGEKIVKARMGCGVAAKPLGTYLHNREHRWAGDEITVERAGKDSHSKTALWRVKVLAKAGDGLSGPVSA